MVTDVQLAFSGAIVQVRAVLGPGRNGDRRFEDAARYLEQLFMHGLTPKSAIS